MLASAPQVATTTDNRHYAIKRSIAICQLYKEWYNEVITIDELAKKIADKLQLNDGTVKTLISQYRRMGVPLPKCNRKSRATSGEIALPIEELRAMWGK
jgi:hypothetical protein